jgi:predicted Zn-dependent peptidase
MKWASEIVWILAFAAASPAATHAASQARNDPPPGFEAFARVDLPNGLRTLIGKPLRTALFSEVLLVAHAGTGTPASHQEEVAHIAAQALTTGQRSADLPPVRVEMARLGVSPEFTVGREVAVFRFAVPTVNTLEFLRLLADVLNRHTLPGEVWQDAIDRRAQELTGEQSDAWQRATSELTGMVWMTSAAQPVVRPVSLRSGSVDITTLAGFWKQAYSPAKMVLSVWGDLPIDQVGPVVEHEFGRIAPANASDGLVAPPEPERRRAGSVDCLQDDSAVPAALLVGAAADVDNDRSFYAWQIAIHILGASSNSRLQRRLRTESQVVYTVEAAGVPVGARGMTLRIACQTDQVEATRKIILEELQRLTSEAVSQEELDLARALLRSRLKLDGASFRDQFYRRSLAMLGSSAVRDPVRAEPILADFTPRTLLEALGPTIRPEQASSVVISTHLESVCEGSHETKP